MTMTVNDSENEKLELKANVNLNEIAETVCAFSNNVGGKILVGVSDSGRVVGVEIGKNTLERIDSYIPS